VVNVTRSTLTFSVPKGLALRNDMTFYRNTLRSYSKFTSFMKKVHQCD
jgi:hypothetical protein